MNGLVERDVMSGETGTVNGSYDTIGREGVGVVLLRRLIGDVLRARRTGQQRTLREVAATARVSLGYLSEVERGQKEASSELLASICGALGVPLSTVLREAADELALAELTEALKTSPPTPPIAEPVPGSVTGSSEVRDSVGAAA